MFVSGPDVCGFAQRDVIQSKQIFHTGFRFYSSTVTCSDCAVEFSALILQLKKTRNNKPLTILQPCRKGCNFFVCLFFLGGGVKCAQDAYLVSICCHSFVCTHSYAIIFMVFISGTVQRVRSRCRSMCNFQHYPYITLDLPFSSVRLVDQYSLTVTYKTYFQAS